MNVIKIALSKQYNNVSIRRPLTAEAWVRSLTSPRGISCEQIVTDTGGFYVISCQYHSTNVIHDTNKS
jgi:hypothetical protein